MGTRSLPHLPAPPVMPAGSAPVRPVAELILSGDVDMQDAPELKRYLTGGLERGCDIVIDLTDVRLIDCVCLGVLARSAGAADVLGSTISLVNPSTLVRRTLEFAATDTLFPIFDDRATASRCR